MEVLWDRSPQSAAEVIEALTAETGWNHRTIRTLLRRLVDKGAVSYSEDGRAYLYAAVLTREQYVRSESRSFLSRVFGGNPLSALTHFVEDEDLSPEELERLKNLVEEKREDLS
jgi:BlaI family penicillinase repressor